MAPEVHVGVAILRVRDVTHPAAQGDPDVLGERLPLAFRNGERRADVRHPAADDVRHGLVENARQLVAECAPRPGEAQERAAPHVAFDAPEVLVESVVVPFWTHRS